jgi:hypothetical protein
MKSLLETFDFNEKQCLNMNKIITGVFMHNFSTPVNDNSGAKNLSWTQMHKNHIVHIEHLGFIC